ncbi:cob(I)yrinic acid a,c-diamide adenosyltransferase [Vibrio sp. 10N.222.51.C12]|uniref:cob(I)yrinic acid a,c-diamide adenosyltransferase n=1 Tax=unclassified Vibrio TaxID=2614977 RepID=UPI000C86783B|nr:cob(I)yrinic acid a,c-diamide adenosyltransferase [Vibrio sp. 10N.286.48.B7]PMH81206.1 ATP:cob(I)alamin adenosyltransferase [Vibrio sp. 10N.286.48.B7]
MGIYTKTGDAGSTSLIGGARVSKFDSRVEAYGTIDELNSHISLAAKLVINKDNKRSLIAVQHQLFYFGAEIATSPTDTLREGQRIIEDQDVTDLERHIDRCMAALPPFRNFVLPGSSEVGSQLHVARAVARRTERRLVELNAEKNLRIILLKYINRISDFLYALARHEDDLITKQTMVNDIVNRYKSGAQIHGHQESAPMKPSYRELSFSEVHRILQQALQSAEQHQIAIVVSIVDENGHLITTYRMPDALLVSTDLAPKKAYTAVALKCATEHLASLVQPGAELYQLESLSDGKVVTFGGGIPIYKGNRIIGAVGISGGSVEQDINIALASIKSII